MSPLGIDLSFEIGDKERHLVRVVLNQTWGGLHIWLDDKIVITSHRMLSLRTMQEFRFDAGEQEPHEILVTLKRKRWLGAYLPGRVSGFVDGNLVATAITGPQKNEVEDLL
jgi:hypothetical protein